ncbi:MAG: hypothetical protein ABI598_07455 [Chloroflexota bacterium]
MTQSIDHPSEQHALATALRKAFPIRRSTPESMLLAAATILAALHDAGFEVRPLEEPASKPPTVGRNI